MEAANRGASEATGISIGLGISLPFESTANPYITRELGFEFHYFFMRKFWFVYLAKALVVFPGGFGTFDELFELLTLVQTRKSSKRMPVVLYGKDFWSEVVNFDALVRWGTISPGDLALFRIADTPDEAFDYLRHELSLLYPDPEADAEGERSDRRPGGTLGRGARGGRGPHRAAPDPRPARDRARRGERARRGRVREPERPDGEQARRAGETGGSRRGRLRARTSVCVRGSAVA